MWQKIWEWLLEPAFPPVKDPVEEMREYAVMSRRIREATLGKDREEFREWHRK
jgi:hypothetical protein